MTVIAEQGLVGHVISVTDTTAKIQTILDTSNTVSATISTSRESIITRGRNVMRRREPLIGHKRRSCLY